MVNYVILHSENKIIQKPFSMPQAFLKYHSGANREIHPVKTN